MQGVVETGVVMFCHGFEQVIPLVVRSDVHYSKISLADMRCQQYHRLSRPPQPVGKLTPIPSSV